MSPPSSFLSSASDPAVIWDRFASYSGELAFDVGANGGEVARILGKNFTTVVAFEPCEESFVHLSELGPPIQPEPLALSDHEGEVTLLEASEAMSSGQLVTGRSLEFSWGQSTGARSVTCSTLDAQMDRWGIPDFVKIDTEGHEARVVAGGLRTFAHRPRLLIEIHDAANADVIEDTLPTYLFKRVYHPGYMPGSVGATNHFWLVSDGA